MSALPQNILDHVVDYVQVSSMLVKRALDERSIYKQAQDKAASLRPALLAHMEKAGVFTPAQKQAVEAMLGSHAETLNLLKNAVDMIVKERTKQASLGKAGDDPTGGHDSVGPGEYDSLNDPHVGRRTSMKKASDRALLRVLEPVSR